MAIQIGPSCIVMRGRDLHEVLAISIEAGNLKDIEDIMHIKLGKPIWHYRTCEIGVAMEIKIVSTDHTVY